MHDLPHLPLQPSDAHSGQALAGAAAWLAVDDDLMLGWECAAPALQIDGWAQECASPQSPP